MLALDVSDCRDLPMRRLIALASSLLLSAGLLAAASSPAHAATPVWSATGVQSFGCDSGEIALDINRSGFDPEISYFFHTRAFQSGKLFMNENFNTTDTDGSGNWGIYADTSGGPTTGTYPMTPGVPVQIYLALESAPGKAISTWKIVLASCDTGVVVSSAAVGADNDGDQVSLPTDACDGAPAPSATDGCPTFTRTTKTSYSAKKDLLKGSLKLPAARADRVYNGLVGDVKVKLYKVVSGKKTKVTTFYTRPNGKFKLKLALGDGKYYTEFASSHDPDNGRAPKVKSKKFVVK